MRALIYGLAFVAASTAIVACGELTGPKSPETPINVTATLLSATSVRISWAASPQSDGVVSYNILRNGTKVGESTTTGYTDSGLAEQTTYKYTVSANCTSGLLSDPSPESPAATVVTIDVTPPRVTAVIPLNNTVGVSRAGTSLVTFSEPMDPATINTTNYNLRTTSTGALIPGTIVYNAAARTAEFKPSAPLPDAANVTVTVTTGAKDLAGNGLAAQFTSNFTTRDETAPTIIATSPVDGATGVSVNAPITVTFSEALDPASVTNTSLAVRVTSTSAAVAGTISYNTTNHSVTFTPNTPLAAPVNYTVTVSPLLKDPAGNAFGLTFEFSFSTGDATPPTVVSTVPVNLATGVATNSVISATFSEPMNPATISTATFTLKVTATSAAVTGTVAYNAATNTATFTPTAPLASSTTYTATISTGAKDVANNALVSNFTWTFITADNIPPTVTSVSPANNATNVATNTVVNISFSEAMDPTTINATNITLKNTVTSAAVAGTVSYNTATGVATFTPTVALANGTGYTVTVTTGVKDLGGNALVTQFTSTFTTAAAPDTTPPTVTSTSPTDGATNIATTTVITATFSEAMDASTISGTTFTLKTTVGGTTISGTVTYNTTTHVATFTPASALANNTGYTATITTGAKDVAGNALVANKVFAFTTIADTTPPTITATTPTNAATGVALTTTVTVTFSEAMDPTTINTTTFSLAVTSPSSAVAGTVSYNNGTHVATFTPSAPLLPSTSYTATVTTGAKDVAGNSLPGTVTFTFTTGP